MAKVSVKKCRFGRLSDGSKVHLYTISNGRMSVSASDYGCTLTSIVLPARGGATVDVLLGYSTLEGFINSDSCFGTIVGRFANRIGGAEFTLDGVKYNLDKNDGKNTLHSGYNRWEKTLWKGHKVCTEYGAGVEFTRTSPQGEQGFPGTVKISVIYTLNEKDELTLEYKAITDKPTHINVTNHAYFNLKGYNGGFIGSHNLQLFCDSYLETDDSHIPTGKILSVSGTPFDFTRSKPMGKDIEAVAPGYDHCFCKKNEGLSDIALVTEPESGRRMLVRTTQPGVQFYTANFIEGNIGKNGFPYKNQGAFCLETQGFPDAPNKNNFPSTVLRPDSEYHQVTQYCFSF